MARPHIEFIPSQVIPFRQGLPGGLRPAVACRILSLDENTGAMSTVLRYPPSWRDVGPTALTVDEELFVLEGRLLVNGRVYGKHAYGHLPAGYVRTDASTEGGAVVLTFFSGVPAEGTAAVDPRRVVEALDTRRLAGQTGKRSHMNSGDWDPSGTLHKTLFHDPVTGDRTWLIGLMPMWSSAKTETHPVVEEEFAILGDICFPMGVMQAGGYFWRPPGIEHGPFATWGGTLHLCRAKGGAFATVWGESDGPVWEPPFAPILPPAYRAMLDAAGAVDREPNY
jgi:hypothetical protein